MLTTSYPPGLNLNVTFSRVSSLNLLLTTSKTEQGHHTLLSHLHFFENFCEGGSRSNSFSGVSSVPRTAPGSHQVPNVPLPDERRNKWVRRWNFKKKQMWIPLKHYVILNHVQRGLLWNKLLQNCWLHRSHSFAFGSHEFLWYQCFLKPVALSCIPFPSFCIFLHEEGPKWSSKEENIME